MDNKDKKMIYVLLIIIVLLIICLGFIIKNKSIDNSLNKSINNSIKYKYNISFKDNKEMIDKGNGVFKNYQEYASYMNKNNLDKKISEKDFNKYNFVYCVLSYDCGTQIYDIEDVKIDNGDVKVVFSGSDSCKCCNDSLFYIIAIDKNISINNVRTTYNFK